MRYYFDLMGDGGLTDDSDGLECAPEQVRGKAMEILAEVAAETKPSEDRISLTVKVRDLEGTAIYEASLLIEGKEVPARR